MHENLLQYVSKFIQLTPLDKEAIELNFKPIKLKRKDFLLKEGMFCDFVAFLNSGVIRHYHIKDDNQMKLLVNQSILLIACKMNIFKIFTVHVIYN